jgi:hypothetical protein
LLGKNMGLHHLIQAKMRREDIHESMVGNALEALIGAIYLDHGFQRTQRAVLLMLKHYGLDEQVHETSDFKSQLHQWATKRKKSLSFDVVRDDENAGDERYEIAAKINGELYGLGVGRSKKLAEQDAARRAWKKVYDRRSASGGDKSSSGDQKPSEGDEKKRSRGAGQSRRRGRGKTSNKSNAAAAKSADRPTDKPTDKPRSSRSRSRRSGRGRGSSSSQGESSQTPNS